MRSIAPVSISQFVDLVTAYTISCLIIIYWLVHTADADETKLYCLVRVSGVNKPIFAFVITPDVV